MGADCRNPSDGTLRQAAPSRLFVVLILQYHRRQEILAPDRRLGRSAAGWGSGWRERFDDPLETQRVYIGPDSLMPIASVFAAIAGFFLMFWRRVVGAMRFMLSKFSKKS